MSEPNCSVRLAYFRRDSLRRLLFAASVIGCCAAIPRNAQAIPYFAHEYGLTCQKCHSVVPRLNDSGRPSWTTGICCLTRRPSTHFRSPLGSTSPTQANPIQRVSPRPSSTKSRSSLRARRAHAPTISSSSIWSTAARQARRATRDAWFAARFTPDNAKIPVYL